MAQFRVFFGKQAAGAPAGVTGTLAATEALDVAAFAGDVIVQGTLAATEGLDTAAFAGGVIVQGQLAATEALDTVAFDGTVADSAISGTLAATDAQDIAAFDGTVSGSGTATGTLAATDPADAAAFSGTASQPAVQALPPGGGGGGVARRRRGGRFPIEPVKRLPEPEKLPAIHGQLRATERPDTAAMRLETGHRGVLNASEPQDTARFKGHGRFLNADAEAAHLAALASGLDYATARAIAELALNAAAIRRGIINRRIIRIAA